MRDHGTKDRRERAIAENERKYGTEARSRYGDAAIEAANERARALSDAEWSEAETLEDTIIALLARARETGGAVGPEARELCRAHARWICLKWGEGAYNREAHAGLARLYLADERFRAYYDERAGKGATDFLVAALLSYLS